ncbi:Crp/Fnr family transcriptional regulator [Enterocloster clostridioformis]|uniref:Crp/Fnr family transcriptional regulator n=1 Tax=Enterocloster clostridioformis TaxID=1531 RepID=UPI002675B554|nr:Crp/Fnr family transcriptional regulator [Enterocloster clostridioformis]
MLIPRYFFAHDYKDFYDYFLSQPHVKKTFQKNDPLWGPGAPLTHIYYILSGIAQTSLEHENGSRKISSLHGSGTVFPGCHRVVFKIEQSIVVTAISDMEVLSFTKEQFLTMFLDNPELSLRTLDWYATYINLLLYEGAHQDYNNSFIKLCNLLYLFSQNAPDGEGSRIQLTQENIAEILTITRVNAARNLARLRDEQIIVPHRKWIEILNFQALESYCSLETLKSDTILKH